MNTTNRRYLMLALEVALVAYFGWRSYDFVTASLTGVSQTVTVLVGLVYVLATDVSFLLWRHVAGPSATTRRQHAIADATAWVLMILTIATSCGDVLLHNRTVTIDTGAIGPVLLFLPVLTVAVNLAALKLFEDADAEHVQALAEREVEFAEVEAGLEVHRQAIVQVRQARTELAGKLAPHIAADVRRKVTERTFAALPAITPEPAPRPAPMITRPEPVAHAMNSETVAPGEVAADRKNGNHS
jgi:hypothetical protein